MTIRIKEFNANGIDKPEVVSLYMYYEEYSLRQVSDWTALHFAYFTVDKKMASTPV